jgi:aconitate hydratase A / 2-methylisocitrate dehydratase
VIDRSGHSLERFVAVGLDDATRQAIGEFRARVRLDTPREREYYRHGGILRFVLHRLLAA